MTPITATAINASAAMVTAINVAPTPPPGSEKLLTGLGYVMWGVSIACVLGVLILGGKMALSAGSSHAGHGIGKGLGFVLGAMVLIGAATAIVGAFLAV